jgi:hypothetical protein
MTENGRKAVLERLSHACEKCVNYSGPKFPIATANNIAENKQGKIQFRKGFNPNDYQLLPGSVPVLLRILKEHSLVPLTSLFISFDAIRHRLSGNLKATGVGKDPFATGMCGYCNDVLDHTFDGIDYPELAFQVELRGQYKYVRVLTLDHKIGRDKLLDIMQSLSEAHEGYAFFLTVCERYGCPLFRAVHIGHDDRETVLSRLVYRTYEDMKAKLKFADLKKLQKIRLPMIFPISQLSKNARLIVETTIECLFLGNVDMICPRVEKRRGMYVPMACFVDDGFLMWCCYLGLPHSRSVRPQKAARA